jgi:hypothetical protein
MYRDDRYDRRPEYPPRYPRRDHEELIRTCFHLFPREYQEIHHVIVEVIDEMDDPERYPIPPAPMIEEMEIEIKRRIYYYPRGEETSTEQFGFGGFFGPFLTTALLFNLLGRRAFFW